MKPFRAVLMFTAFLLILFFVQGAMAAENYILVSQWKVNSGYSQIAIDTSNNVYVTDCWKSTVLKYDSNGTFLTQWGSFGSGNGQFINSWAIAVGKSGNIYVSEVNALPPNRIQMFDSDGKFIKSWNVEPYAWRLTTDKSGNIYAATFGSIIKFDSNGNYLDQWNTHISANGYASPTDVAIDSSGDIVVTTISWDNNNNTWDSRIQKYNPDGTFITEWGNFNNYAQLFGLAIDQFDNLYVSDGTIQKFKSDGTFLTKIGPINEPDDLAIDSSGNVYVTDMSGYIDKFAQVVSGNISVTSKPSGAKIFLDGKDTRHITPFTLPDVAEGNHQVSVTKDCYLTPDPKNVIVVAGETVTTDFTLQSTGSCIPEFPSMVVPAAVLVGCVGVVLFLAKRE